jgi:hypothetical protein
MPASVDSIRPVDGPAQAQAPILRFRAREQVRLGNGAVQQIRQARTRVEGVLLLPNDQDFRRRVTAADRFGGGGPRRPVPDDDETPSHLTRVPLARGLEHRRRLEAQRAARAASDALSAGEAVRVGDWQAPPTVHAHVACGPAKLRHLRRTPPPGPRPSHLPSRARLASGAGRAITSESRVKSWALLLRSGAGWL